jgi:geranylgeranyl transferase type-1 subunit beta
MMAAYFSLAALELLGALDSHATREERRGFAEWIYAAQHPGGGFRAAPAPTPEADEEEKEGAEPGGSGGGGGGGPDAGDPATVPNTYFALAALAVLRDDLSRVRRGECLRWLGRCQRADGSVGQYVEEDGRPGGGSDTRFSYMAVGVRWFLRGAAGDGGAREGGAEREGLDVEALVRNVAMLQTYDGGFCEVPFREAHGECLE